MLLRALIVLLLVLNLGVAAWWWQRDSAPAAVPAAAPAGVAPLRLLSETAPRPRTAVKPALAQAVPAAVVSAPDPAVAAAAN
ncbi:hypothetical protein [Lysobacter sp. Root983]|uniref:hypothetical protein n=1 Tax=Lysobacter sp. Root983 TaxID=1736613 RepID=UPI00070AFA2F|nr:hypothetical protein [Lysobacter sp. Root983]KRD77300.1 hypothetical protein ASE43_09095 [Lysobacter sp. Root983]